MLGPMGLEPTSDFAHFFTRQTYTKGAETELLEKAPGFAERPGSRVQIVRLRTT